MRPRSLARFLVFVGASALILAFVMALVVYIVRSASWSINERIFLIEIPSYNRLDAIGFSSIAFSQHLNLDGRGDLVSHITKKGNIVVWKGYDSSQFTGDRAPSFNFYDARSRRSISSNSETGLIAAVDREFGVNIASLFPIPNVDKYIRGSDASHLIIEPWEYELLISDFNKALEICLSDGVAESSGKIKDFRGLPILTEVVEDGSGIRLYSSKPDGSLQISLVIYLEHVRSMVR